MSGEIIIAIITAAIALLTSVISFIYTFSQDRKNRIQRVILENRNNYLNEIRNGFSNFIGLANLKIIRYAQKNPDSVRIYITDLLIGYGKLKTYLKPFYKIDKEIIAVLDRLYDCILSNLNGEKSADSIDELREDFTDKYLKYDWAYWKYIQVQKGGNFVNSDDAFDKVYYDFLKQLETKTD